MLSWSVCVCTDVSVSARVFARLWLCGEQRYGSVCVDSFSQRHLPPFLRAPFPVKSFSQTNGIWSGQGRAGDGRGDSVPEPLVWG